MRPYPLFLAVANRRGSARTRRAANQCAIARTSAARSELVSESNRVKKDFAIPADGRYLASELAFGVYRLTVTAQGFAPWSDLLDVRSEVPVRVAVVLGVAPVNMKIEVSDAATILDPSQTGTIYSLGSDALREHTAAQDGRDLSDAVNDQPGWLYEANGVLHPRGSEYQVQYVLDGMPLTQNRSPAFAPPLDAGDVESMRVMNRRFPCGVWTQARRRYRTNDGKKSSQGMAWPNRGRGRQLRFAERHGGNWLHCGQESSGIRQPRIS